LQIQRAGDDSMAGARKGMAIMPRFTALNLTRLKKRLGVGLRLIKGCSKFGQNHIAKML
jgi:hypothetical protein